MQRYRWGAHKFLCLARLLVMHLLDSVMIALSRSILNGLEPVGVSCMLPIHLGLDLSTPSEEHPCQIGYSRRTFDRILTGPRSLGGIYYRLEGLFRAYFSTLESGPRTVFVENSKTHMAIRRNTKGLSTREWSDAMKLIHKEVIGRPQ
ncbi:hypothetical protein BDV38DRAFT_28312 [Aspergillus pseudotamarii]|uniref:Uncharacterized protein n=1 Tax=Aspergillus pseudotamarii TaxID=132259 RepID=A0A5N6T1X7_ASPPS|nr:uncharacterized protein BDV38DRAFT_28312 [Aspergillus pseudotamarii]KAE8140291.1 hypothetical protein BDV38DRAFT_28312 [Aspergillus pseudotamarii]